MMGIIVSKFGGSSMADAIMFQRVNDIISKKRKPCYIILSAPGRRNAGDVKITDLLCLAHHQTESGLDPTSSIHQIRERFRSIIQALKLSDSSHQLLSSLEDDVSVSRDYAASRGEYLCARLFAEYADIPFVDASSLIHFDETGRILPDEICKSVRAMSKRLDCAVIPGFYGSKPDGTIKTFSRGGSDITGSLIAAALSADIYENWTDVDGLMSIDPAICPQAVHHPAVSYHQMRRFAEAGAQVLHPCCLEPVQRAGVPTELRNTFHPDRPGTYISDSYRKKVACICASDHHTVMDLDCLHSQTKMILKDRGGKMFTGPDGQKMITLNAVHSETPATIVSVFGIPLSRRAAAIEIAAPIGYLLDEDCIQFLIQPERKKAVMTKLHRLLFNM